MAGALHDGLRAGERQAVAEALDHSEIAVAAEQEAKLGEAERLKEFGIVAARDVEAERIVGSLSLLNLKAAATGPDRPNLLQCVEIAAVTLGQPGAIGVCPAEENVPGYRVRLLRPERTLKGLHHGNEDTRLDLAAFEIAQGVRIHAAQLPSCGCADRLRDSIHRGNAENLRGG